MCYMQVGYSEDRTFANVKAKCRQHESVSKVEYNWAGKGFTGEDSFAVSAENFGASEGDLTLTVRATDNEDQ